MAPPQAASERQLKHRRSIDLAVYAREDGLWEVDARLIDTKTRDYPLAGGVRPAGDPVHDMTLSLVIDTQMNILAAQARTDWEERKRFGEVAAYEGPRLNAPSLVRFARPNPAS